MREFKERPECYHLSRQVMGNHVPLDNLRVGITPAFYCCTITAEVTPSSVDHESDTIALSFVNHKVKIAGRNLRALAALALPGRAVRGGQRTRAGKIR